jgi:hypothetical protein
MKKSKKAIIISIALIVIILLVPVVVYTYYDLFIDDVYGDKYSQNWTNSDGSITFVTDNSKGLLGDNHCYNGTMIVNNESQKIKITNDNVFEIISDDGDKKYLEGSSFYNPLSETLTVDVTETSVDYLKKLKNNELVFRKEK